MFDCRIMPTFEICPSPIKGRDMVRFPRFMVVDVALGVNIELLAID